MRVILTGGCGFIGSHVAEELCARGHDTMILDNLFTGSVSNIMGVKRVKFNECSILNRKALYRWFTEFEPEAVVHLAAQPAIGTSIEDPEFDFVVNAAGTMMVIQACRMIGLKKLVFSSTSAVYGESKLRLTESSPTKPDSPYGLSKLTAEMYIRHIMPESVILRFGNVFGPRQVPLGENQLIARAISHFEHGSDFKIHGDGQQKRDFVYVKDVARAVAKAIGGPAGTYNICRGSSRSVNDVLTYLENIYEIFGYKWEHDEVKDGRGGVEMSNGLASSQLDWIPQYSVVDGVAETVKWWKNMKSLGVHHP